MEKKKMNPIVFMIVATLLNVVLIALLFVVMIVILALLKSPLGMSDDTYSVLSAAAMILSLVLSFFIYRKIAYKINEKYDLGKGRDMRRD